MSNESLLAWSFCSIGPAADAGPATPIGRSRGSSLAIGPGEQRQHGLQPPQVQAGSPPRAVGGAAVRCGLVRHAFLLVALETRKLGDVAAEQGRGGPVGEHARTARDERQREEVVAAGDEPAEQAADAHARRRSRCRGGGRAWPSGRVCGSGRASGSRAGCGRAGAPGAARAGRSPGRSRRAWPRSAPRRSRRAPRSAGRPRPGASRRRERGRARRAGSPSCREQRVGRDAGGPDDASRSRSGARRRASPPPPSIDARRRLGEDLDAAPAERACGEAREAARAPGRGSAAAVDEHPAGATPARRGCRRSAPAASSWSSATVSTPAKPAPANTNVRRRSADSGSASASSIWRSTWLRRRIASPRSLSRARARAGRAGRGMRVTAPSAITRSA